MTTEVPVVRCHLDGHESDPVRTLRYVALVEFDLWRHLMETRHHRRVRVDEVSVWVAEAPELWTSIADPERLEPVLRVRFEKPGLLGYPVPVERFLPAETYPEAQEALLSHYAGSDHVVATPGYFVPNARPDMPTEAAPL
jgi:hypothetical protein